jgi:uroporphyrinogen-III synthase
MLTAHNIQVHEIVAYQTILTPHKIHINYDGLIFFSPSAVRSYLSENTILNEQILFAIGDTTAAAIEQTGNTSVISTSPDKQKMIETIVQYYNIPLLNK